PGAENSSSPSILPNAVDEPRPRRNIKPTPAGHAFLEEITRRNERLTRLRANRDARVLPHQGLTAILDIHALSMSQDMQSDCQIDSLADLKTPAILDFKAYAAFGSDPPWFRTP
ncbi:hypothetical protein C0992_001355, partial [Termitomyces sp. T32_za158]